MRGDARLPISQQKFCLLCDSFSCLHVQDHEHPKREHLRPREVALLRFMLEGLSNKEIAVKMGVTHGSVKKYMFDILRVLGLHDRTQAALWAERHGIGVA